MSRKTAIFSTAIRFFSQKGFKDTSMADLAKMSGTAQGTVFYHFHSKEELFISVLEEIKRSIIMEFEEHLRDKEFGRGLDMVEDTVSFYLYLAGTMEEQFLLLHRHDAYELAEVNTICRHNLESIYNSILDIFERGVVLGQQDGSIGEMPARKTALIIFSMVDGLVRFNTYKLYEAGTLYSELMASCRRILQNKRS